MPGPYELTEDDISEYRTRKTYIDKDLRDTGWTENRDWVNEFELKGMPNPSGVGYADYVLFGDDGRPLAVIEAKRTTVDISIGRHQAELYADLLEKMYRRRPIIFLTNGFETHVMDDRNYQERKVSGIYCKRDLEKLFNLNANRSPKLASWLSGPPLEAQASMSTLQSRLRSKASSALLSTQQSVSMPAR